VPEESSQHPVEIIMARGLMSNLTTPAFLVDREGTLIFFNEAASELLGIHYEEAGAMPAEEWGSRFEPTAQDGTSLTLQDLPLAIALRESRPAHRHITIRALDGKRRDIDVSAFPIVGREGQTGAMAIFWDGPA
jgi:PAS domain-containing protein